MSLFRTNYLPKGEIFKDSKTGKYFFTQEAGIANKSLQKDEEGNIRFGYKFYEYAYYDTIEELMKDLYKVAISKHVKQLHLELTYSKGIKI